MSLSPGQPTKPEESKWRERQTMIPHHLSLVLIFVLAVSCKQSGDKSRICSLPAAHFTCNGFAAASYLVIPTFSQSETFNAHRLLLPFNTTKPQNGEELKKKNWANNNMTLMLLCYIILHLMFVGLLWQFSATRFKSCMIWLSFKKIVIQSSFRYASLILRL